MLDPQDEQFDRRLATHLVSLYHQSMAEEESAHLDMAILRDYIAFARTYVHPDLSEEAGQALIQAYVGEGFVSLNSMYVCIVTMAVNILHQVKVIGMHVMRGRVHPN